MKRITAFLVLALTLIVAIGYQNCSKVAVSDLQSEDPQIGLVIPLEPENPNDPVRALRIQESAGFVCSAFGSVTVPSEKSGLKTELRYLSTDSNLSVDEKNSILATEYFNDSNPAFVKAPETLFLSDVNVPTRNFETGFVNSSGSFLKDNDGYKLIEYFGLRMESLLKLGPNDLEGWYDIASVSDDGTVVQIKENGQWVTLISNDGAHSTRMGCTDRKIKLTKESRIPIRIFYNQGPRTQIANVLIWNYRGNQASPADNGESHAFCGRASTENFWRSSDSAPGTWIAEVFWQGWKVPTADNFQLPDNEVNPCAYSTYDVHPEVTAHLISGTKFSIQMKSQDSTVLTANLYKVGPDQQKTLVQTLTLAESFEHSFETESLDQTGQFHLELTMEIPSKKIKVLKTYELKFETVL